MKLKKGFKRMVSMLLVAVMCLAMCLTGYAAGDCSITVENSIGGVTYSLYKVFDATYSNDGVSYTIGSSSPWYNLVDPSQNEDSPFVLTSVDSSSTTFVVSMNSNIEGAGEEAIAEFFNGLTATQLESVASTKNSTELSGDGGSIKWTGLDAGYYLIVPASDKYTDVVVSVDTAHPDATVVDKNQTPTLEKKVDKDNYSIGDTATYTIEAYVPTYVGEDQIASYEFVDVMDAGLSYDVDSIKIVITGTGVDGDDPIVLDPDDDYCTVTYDSKTNTLTISYNILDEKGDLAITGYPADATVTITYTATVTEAADDIDIHNDVILTWKTVDGDKPDNPPEDETRSYTFGFDLKKADSTGNILTGAEFTLQKQTGSGEDATGGENIKFDYNESNDAYEVAEDPSASTVTDTIVVKDGQTSIWGLAEGTYILTETKAPEGYNLLTAPIVIEITENTAEGADGKTTVTGWTIVVDRDTANALTVTISDGSTHGVTSIPVVTVVNNAGTLLPGTGGMGTTLFYVIGGLLVLIGAAFVVAKMRLGKTE